ncbi:MAG: hypothetical protein NZT92_10310 [Abditibacteriales bacterium]|nr:hypothetical protein [Abditibacteriales bacterium]MDW8366902.1 hypothetical protein [Abditibacteriales bacterium]
MADFITPPLPKDLQFWRHKAERMRRKSLRFVQLDADGTRAVEMLQRALDVIHDLTKVHPHRDEDELTIQFLGIRLFNAIVTSYEMMLCGYYQVSLALQRDIIEVGLLLDYFDFDRTQIRHWREADNEERKKHFKQVKIRETLDARDGQVAEERRRIYEMYCEYAAHPTYAGNILLAPRGLGEIGPFFEEELLRHGLFELTRQSLWAATNYLALFSHLSPPLKASVDRFIHQAFEWFENNVGRLKVT